MKEYRYPIVRHLRKSRENIHQANKFLFVIVCMSKQKAFTLSGLHYIGIKAIILNEIIIMIMMFKSH